MTATLTVECVDCLEDLSLDILICKNTMPSFGEIRRLVAKQGWHLGRACRCPACFDKLPEQCKTCSLYEGNKSMGTAVCRLDGSFSAPNDYCPEHKPFRGYRNPIPTLD